MLLFGHVTANRASNNSIKCDIETIGVDFGDGKALALLYEWPREHVSLPFGRFSLNVPEAAHPLIGQYPYGEDTGVVFICYLP